MEIGAGTTIDRGANRDTIIGEGTKIDNLVQIGHNVVIGRHCVFVSQSGVSGSCVVEDFVALGGQAGLAGHLHIGAGAQIAASAGVMNDVPAGETWGGAPAQPAARVLSRGRRDQEARQGRPRGDGRRALAGALANTNGEHRRTPSRITARRNGAKSLSAVSPSPRMASTGAKPASSDMLRRIDRGGSDRRCRGAARRHSARAAHRRRCRGPAARAACAALNERQHIAQAEVQALRADRRKDVRGVADQRHARRGQSRDRLPDHRKHAAFALETHLAEQGRASGPRSRGERGVAQRGAASALRHPTSPRRGWSGNRRRPVGAAEPA